MTHREATRLGVVSLALALLVLTVSVIAIPAQEPMLPDAQATLVGQLSTDDMGAYVLIETGSGETVYLISSKDLDQYLGAEIEVVGSWAEDAEGFRYFVVDHVQGKT